MAPDGLDEFFKAFALFITKGSFQTDNLFGPGGLDELDGTRRVAVF